MSEENSKPVLLKTCGDNAEAALLRSFLASHDIPCTIQGENHRSLLGAVGAYIELNVLVPENLAGAARELLHELDAGGLPEAEDDESVGGVVEEGAVCAVHPRPAVGTCDRCGAFMCEVCRAGDAETCSACEKQLEEPPGRGARARRRRIIALTMLFFFLGGPVIAALLLRALESSFWGR